MLERIIIRNIALIETLDMTLNNGLNVLTGETGAGKSIIIDGVNLILGERANKEIISTGKPKARVEAFFDIKNNEAVIKTLREAGIEAEDGSMAIVREITAAGKSFCRINGEIVSLAMLKSVADSLVDVHGQHEHQSLLNPQKHTGVVDSYGEADILPLRQRVNSLYSRYVKLNSELNSGFLSESERERRLDVLSYQIREIDGAKLTENEESAINEELLLLSNSERINSALEKSGELISGDGGALENLRLAASAMGNISELSSQYAQLHTKLEGLFYELEDAAYELRDIRLNYEYDPERLNALENRLDIINSLKRKYGGSVSAALEFKAEAEKELSEIKGSEERREQLFKARLQTEAEYKAAAYELTEKRKASASRLERAVCGQLKDLGMEKAKFAVKFYEPDGGIHPNGVDNAEFLLSANPGEPLRPLAKVASGGELSRIMLALKTAGAEADGIETLIFDEIDSGISGRTAVAAGEKMADVAKTRQVLCITHLPQIAAFADCHFLVKKISSSEKTETVVNSLPEEERRSELARIMGSVNPGDAAVKYAGELIKSAQKYKIGNKTKQNELNKKESPE